MKEEIYISYAWIKSPTGNKGHSTIVNSIEKKLKGHFSVKIDKKDLKYKGNIKEFEQRLGRNGKIVIVISDKFLKSKHCMHEVQCIVEKGNVYERIFPVVLDDADIYNSKGILKYAKYWEKEKEKLEKELKKTKSQANLIPVQNDINLFSKYREIIAGFIAILNNMNTLTPEIHEGAKFEQLIEALYGKNPRPDHKQEKDYAKRISETKKLFDSAIKIIEKEIKERKIKAEEILGKIRHFQNQCTQQTFQIAVMAILKSGKSTFLNSLLGNEFLPVSNVAATSVPVRINHSRHKDGYLTFGKSKIDGVEKIRKQIELTNEEKRDKGMQEVQFNLFASFRALEDKEMTDIKFEILDTPGFGEALTEITIGKTIDESNLELIDKISAIIYLLDYTKLKTTDEDKVFAKLTEMRSDILDKISDRLFFIINKIDEENRNSLPPDKVVDYVFDIVKTKMPNVLKQHIFTISANRALLSRLILFENATSEAKKDFGRMAFGFKANQKDESEYKEVAREILAASNILEVESRILNHIFDNRSRIFVEGLQDSLKHLMKEFKNKFIITAEGVLSRTIEEITDLESKIEAAKKKQQSIQDEADKFETEIKEWNEIEFRNFEKSITDQIDSAFNIEKVEEKQSFWGRMMPNWVKRVGNKLREVQDSVDSSSKYDVEESIRALNKEINEELINSFGIFRRELENKLASKQKALFESLKQTINTLAKEFESTLKKGLKVEFEQTEVRLDEPDFDRTLIKADELIDRFVQSDWKGVRVAKKEKVYNERKNCYLGGYDTFTTYETQYFEENRISKTSLELFWKKVIDDRHQNAKGVTNKLLENSIKAQIKNARKSFDTYVGDYLLTIQEQKARLTNSDKSEIANQIAHLRQLNETVSSIIQDLK